MDINTIKSKYEPIDGQWFIREQLGSGSYGDVFRIERSDLSGTYKAALKIISIPRSKNELDYAYDSLQSESSVTQYFEGLTQKLVTEFNLMSKLKGNSNIVSYEDHKIIKHTDGVGYDVLIRMELLTPLNKKIFEMKEYDVVKLGIDICRALEICGKFNIVHRDIKPENIFVSDFGDYKLGDFGVAKTMNKSMSFMTTTGTYSYMAPELKKGEECAENVDIYSLGIVMYKLVNGNRDPFLPLPPHSFTFEQKDEAMIRRFSGEALPAPAYASQELSKIILKACCYNAAERYQSASQMKRDLEKLLFSGMYDDSDLAVFGDESEALEAEEPVVTEVEPESIQEEENKNETVQTPENQRAFQGDATVSVFGNLFEASSEPDNYKQEGTEEKAESVSDVTESCSEESTEKTTEPSLEIKNGITVTLKKKQQDGIAPYAVHVFVDGVKMESNLETDCVLTMKKGQHIIEIVNTKNIAKDRLKLQILSDGEIEYGISKKTKKLGVVSFK